MIYAVSLHGTWAADLSKLLGHEVDSVRVNASEELLHLIDQTLQKKSVVAVG